MLNKLILGDACHEQGTTASSYKSATHRKLFQGLKPWDLVEQKRTSMFQVLVKLAKTLSKI